MTDQEYRAAEGVNKSTLWHMMRSPAHYKYYLMNQQQDTDSFRLGRAVHAAILTPGAYKRDFAVIPDIDRRTKAGKEAYEDFVSATAGKELISHQEGETVKNIAAAVRANRDAMNLLRGTVREKPLFWTDDNGVLCKCRIDAYRSGVIIDIKTAANAETDAFTKEALKYGYDVQAAHYIDGYQHKRNAIMPEWYFIVVEKTEPFSINILRADIGFIDHGIILRQQLIEKLIQCRESGNYPGYGINELCLPKWAEV
jgi:exodeoxyribonuclease VIII